MSSDSQNKKFMYAYIGDASVRDSEHLIFDNWMKRDAFKLLVTILLRDGKFGYGMEKNGNEPAQVSDIAIEKNSFKAIAEEISKSPDLRKADVKPETVANYFRPKVTKWERYVVDFLKPVISENLSRLPPFYQMLFEYAFEPTTANMADIRNLGRLLIRGANIGVSQLRKFGHVYQGTYLGLRYSVNRFGPERKAKITCVLLEISTDDNSTNFPTFVSHFRRKGDASTVHKISGFVVPYDGLVYFIGGQEFDDYPVFFVAESRKVKNMPPFVGLFLRVAEQPKQFSGKVRFYKISDQPPKDVDFDYVDYYDEDELTKLPMINNEDDKKTLVNHIVNAVNYNKGGVLTTKPVNRDEV